jgi:hypothetical protein
MQSNNFSDELFDLHMRIGNLARNLHACQDQIARLCVSAIERDLPTAIASEPSAMAVTTASNNSTICSVKNF